MIKEIVGRVSGRTGLLAAIAAAGALAIAAAAPKPAGHTGRFEGSAVKIGQGTARLVVLTDNRGALERFGVELTAGALQGLPAHDNPGAGTLNWYYNLQFPKGAPATGFDHVMIDWNPHGHVPPGVYTVPHFDFHFFVINQTQQDKIRYPHEEQGMEGVEMPAPDLMAPGYIIPPGTQINRMGIHAVDRNAPELHGQPFTSTFVYGYYARQLVFIEPMVAFAYLTSRPDMTRPIPAPAAYSFPAHYPTQYRVTYDAARQVYQVLLGGLKSWSAPRSARR